MRRHTLVLLAALALAATASAQTATDDSGREVRRIVFNGEQVSVVYGDGDRQDGVQQTRVKATQGVATGIGGTKAQATGKRSALYSADGRQLGRQPMKKGVYIERRGGKAVKRVRK